MWTKREVVIFFAGVEAFHTTARIAIPSHDNGGNIGYGRRCAAF